MIIYIVQSDWGQYDDARERIEKAFYSLKQAEDFKNKFELIERSPMEECPVDEMIEDDWTPDDYERWSEWFRRKCEKHDFNGCYIEEVELL